MAVGVLDIVGQVVPRLGQHWWNIEEKQYFKKFSELEPTVFSTIFSKLHGAIADADFSEAPVQALRCRAAGPHPLPKPLKEYNR